MKKISNLGVVLLSIGLFALSCGKDDGPDTPGQQNTVEIDEVDPLSGPVGTLVTLDGKNFGDTMADNTVKFNGVAAIIKTASTTRLTVEVPDGATDGPITVKVGDDMATSSSDFTVTADNGTDVIELNFTELELHTLDTQQLEVTNLAKFEGNPTVEWKVNDDNLLEIDEEGNVTALNSGQASVKATIGQLTQVCSINISPSVFVVGEEYNGDNDIATLWKNGEGTILETAGFGSYANDVFVHRKDVYAAGHETHTENIPEYIGKVWKNGSVLYTLKTDTEDDFRITSIYVTESGDVYNSGFGFQDNFVAIAQVWRNGQVEYVLNDADGYDTTIVSIFVTDQGVFTVGTQIIDDQRVATVWKNDQVLYILNENENDVYANSIFVDENGNVYVAGSEAGQNDQIAKIWKNGSVFYEAPESSSGSYYSAFAIDNNVYACGHELNGATYEAQIYENGTVSNFTDGITSALTYSIFVHDGSSYISGYQNNDEMNKVATVWKDKKQLYALGDGKTHSEASSIFVK
ncbi:MAG: IPT/TIG domain-containing protein [Bacteroidota bacterium]